MGVPPSNHNKLLKWDTEDEEDEENEEIKKAMRRKGRSIR